MSRLGNEVEALGLDRSEVGGNPFQPISIQLGVRWIARLLAHRSDG